MILIVGLGNPGAEHTWNRHNIGFMAVDGIVQRYKFAKYRSRFSGFISHGEIDSERTAVLKPTTFMNESGRSVGEATRFFKLSVDQIIVIHDDLDLSPGKVRVKAGGGAAGHKGLQSIDSHISKGYWRIRLGIGRPVDSTEVSDFVLSDFAKDDRSWLDKVIPALVEAMPLILRGDGAGFTNKVSLLINPKLEGSSSNAGATAAGDD